MRALVLLPFALAGCFAPDVDALAAQLDRCRLAMAPLCVSDDDVQREMTRRRLAVRVRSPEQQACILTADCAGPDFRTESILPCMHERSVLEQLTARERDCAQACDSDLNRCGDDGCSLDEAQACVDARDACVHACPLALLPP